MQNIEWRCYEYAFQEKSADWYWALGIIAVSVSVTSIIFNNILFAVLVVLSAFSLGIYANRKPLQVTCRLTGEDIRFGKNMYPYGTLESFWVETKYGTPRIIIKSKKAVMPHIVMPIAGVNPDAIRNFLSGYLREEEQHEPISHKIMESLGF